MSSLNGLRQIIALAMRDGDNTVTVSLEAAQKIIIESDKHRISAMDALDEIEAARSIMERVNGEKQVVITAADRIEEIIDLTILEALDSTEVDQCLTLLENYRAAKNGISQ